MQLDLLRVQKELEFALLSYTELLDVGCVWGTCAPSNSLLLHKHAAIITLVAFLANIFIVNHILTEYLWGANTMDAQIYQIYEWEMIFSSSSSSLGFFMVLNAPGGARAPPDATDNHCWHCPGRRGGA